MSTSLKLSNSDILDLDLMCKMMTFTISNSFSTASICTQSLYAEYKPYEIERIKNFTYKLMKKVMEDENSDNSVM